MNRMIQWKEADKPPRTEKGCWSNQVVVLTNYGNVMLLSYYGDHFYGDRLLGGTWQRPHNMEKGELPEYWIEMPGEIK